MYCVRLWVLTVSTALSLGCAGSDDPGGVETEAGSSSTSDGSTSAVATSSGTAGGSSTSSTTDAAQSSSSTSGGDGSSSSSGGSSSGPGCYPGTEDCSCDGGRCVEGLVCSEDGLCEQPPNCPQEASEPNDSEMEAQDVGDFDDFDPTFEVVDGRLPVGGDEDWFTYHCEDFVLGQVDMNYEIDTNIPVRVCQFIACDVASDPAVVCPDGSEAAMSPDGLPGCCSDLDALSIGEIDCSPDSGDDSGQIFVRVDMPAQDMCVSYDLGLHC